MKWADGLNAMTYRRYAIFHCPPTGALARFAADWLGWEAAGGRACAHPQVEGLPMAVEKITRRPRYYGFHATLRAPFRLSADFAERDLEHVIKEMAASSAPVELSGLHLARIGGFLALMPDEMPSALEALAARAVTGVEPLRAPLSEEEIARRHAAGLTPQQEAHLLRWGYPYVFEEFRYHMTLSGPLRGAALEQVRDILEAHLMPLVPRPYRIDEISLMGEDRERRFHEIRRFALGAKSAVGAQI